MQPNQASFIAVGTKDSAWVQSQPCTKLKVLCLPAWKIMKTVLDSGVKNIVYLPEVWVHTSWRPSPIVLHVPLQNIQYLCIIFQKPYAGSWTKPLAGERGERSSCCLRSNIHGVWMRSLISLINNHLPVPAIRSWGSWPWAEVTDLLP